MGKHPEPAFRLDPATSSFIVHKDESVQDTTIFRGTVIGKFTTAGGEDYPDARPPS